MNKISGLIFANYALSFLLMYMCFAVLSKTRYTSIFAYFSLANVIQIGMGLFFLPEYAYNNQFSFDDYSYERYLIAQLIYISVTTIFVLILYPQSRRLQSPENEVHEIYKYTYLYILVAIIFIYIRISSPASIHVLKNIGSAFSADHYSVRSELISIGADNYSRFSVHFVNIARSFLTLGLLIFSYNWNLFGRISSKRMAYILFSVLAVDGFLKLQKAPVVILALISISPFFLKKMREGGVGNYKNSGRLVVYSILFLVASFFITVTLVAYVFQDLTFEQGMFLLFDRIIFIPELSTLMHFRAYPDMIPFVNLAGIRSIADLFELSTAPLYGSIALDVAQVNTGILYNANAGFLANAWANFGYGGVLVYSILVGILFRAIDLYVDGYSNKMPVWPLAAYFASGFIVYANVSMEDVIIIQGLFFVPYFYKNLSGKN